MKTPLFDLIFFKCKDVTIYLLLKLFRDKTYRIWTLS